MMQQRLARLQHIVKTASLDAIALVPGANLRYLSGQSFHLMERPLILFVPAEGEAAVVIPSLEVQRIHEAGFTGHVLAWRDADGYLGAFDQAAALLGLAGKRVGVEGLTMRVKEGQIIEGLGASVIDADPDLVNLRVHKLPDEIENHRRAMQISERALATLLEQIQLGMTERHIAKLLSDLQGEYGGAGNSFETIVLIGPRSAMPHGEPGDTPLQQGDTLLIDFGTRYNGYISDITRTFFVGEPSAQVKAMYAAVLAANQAARQAARPGITGAELDRIATQQLIDAGFSDYIKHRTGHGIGMDVHEHPNVSAENTRPMEAGMVFTIEPGLYAEGLVGIRIEDNVTITPDGAETLTTFPRELTVLDL